MPIIVPDTGGMTFDDLQTEFYARGYTYLNENAAGQIRAKRWLNLGYSDLLEEADWPFLNATITGTAPLTLTGAREVLSVMTRDGALTERSISDLDDDFNLTTPGTASYWYTDGAQVKTYPVDGQPITVRYSTVPADMVGTSDIPVVPGRYRYLIVDFAVIRALRDRSNYAEADALWQAVQVDLTRMRTALLGQDPMFQRLTDPTAA